MYNSRGVENVNGLAVGLMFIPEPHNFGEDLLHPKNCTVLKFVDAPRFFFSFEIQFHSGNPFATEFSACVLRQCRPSAPLVISPPIA